MKEHLSKQQDGRQVARTDTAKNAAAPTSAGMRISRLSAVRKGPSDADSSLDIGELHNLARTKRKCDRFSYIIAQYTKMETDSANVGDGVWL